MPRHSSDLLLRVPPVGEPASKFAPASATLGGGGGMLADTKADEAHQLLEQAEVRAEPTFTDRGPLGLKLHETRIPTVFSGTLVHLDGVEPGSQAAVAAPELREHQLLIKVNGDSILGMPYERVLELLKMRPVTLTFAQSPHLEEGEAEGQQPPAPGEEYTRMLSRVNGSFGFNLAETEHGDVTVDSFTNEAPAAAGVLSGSLLLWVQGHDVRGEGNAGAGAAIAECAGQESVEFVFLAPADPAGLGVDLGLGSGIVPFDCTFEDSGPLGLAFISLQTDRGGTPAFAISTIESGTQADQYTYLRPGMEVTGVNGQSIAGLGHAAVLARCGVRPVTLTMIDPQLGAAAAIDDYDPDPYLGAGEAGGGAGAALMGEHGDVAATATILAKVDSLLATTPAVLGRADDAHSPAHMYVGAGGSGAMSSSAATGPQRESRRWREDEADRTGDSNFDLSGAAEFDEHDDLLRRIDELYARQANRSTRLAGFQISAAPDINTSAQEKGQPHGRVGSGWGARAAGGGASAWEPPAVERPASSAMRAMRARDGDDHVQLQIEERRLAREARRQGRQR